MNNSVLQCTNVSKSFGGIAALQDVSLTLGDGEIVALIGPNGAGKSTLVNVISGALTPDLGDIRLCGRELNGLSVSVRATQGLGRSFQVSSVFASMTVIDNLRVAICAGFGGGHQFWRRAGSDPSVERRVDELVERFGLSDVARSQASTLAHGQKRALELALTLAGNPRAMVLDEPLAGMGPEESERIVGMLATLVAKTPILLIEHDMDAVFQLAHRITVLVNGKVIATGAPKAIRDNPLVQSAYLGSNDA